MNEINDFTKVRGDLHIVLRDEHGNIKEDRLETNLVVNTGLAFITSRMYDGTTGVMSHMGVGSGSTAAAGTQSALVTELGRSALYSTTRVTTTVSNDAIQYVATFGAGVGTGSLQEAGILNAASAGTMLSRVIFGVITKGAADTLTITWKVTIAAS